MFLGWGLYELSRGCAVSDRCGLVESEHDGQVERVGSVGECVVELTVDAEGFQGGSSGAERRVENDVADGSGVEAVSFVDDQVRVGGVTPASLPVSEPVDQGVSSSRGRVTEPMVSRRLPKGLF
ncbi:hypothetical protein ACQP2U_24215 [Nocardia sp. CA-084685]|uniref:hypothetical protein n=1 Tax=Nocardia sp. CA-084685 TaxID=3239970 RepID=UPI003D95ACE7